MAQARRRPSICPRTSACADTRCTWSRRWPDFRVSCLRARPAVVRYLRALSTHCCLSCVVPSSIQALDSRVAPRSIAGMSNLTLTEIRAHCLRRTPCSCFYPERTFQRTGDGSRAAHLVFTVRRPAKCFPCLGLSNSFSTRRIARRVLCSMVRALVTVGEA